MKKIYKIKDIVHSGLKGERGTPVTNIKYKYVIGYKCFFDKDEIELGWSFSFYFINNPEYICWGMSAVERVEEKPLEKELIIETRNSIYTFKELGDYEMSERATEAYIIVR